MPATTAGQNGNERLNIEHSEWQPRDYENFLLIVASMLVWASLPARAANYTDATGDFTGGAGFLDMTSVQVDNNASTLTFVINLASDPSVPANNWGTHLIGFDTNPGGNGNINGAGGWSKNIQMSQSGMDFFIGTASRYAKPIILAETAFPWTNSTNIYGIPATPEGQVQFVIELAKIVKAVPGGRGIGIFWWGTEYVQLPGYNLAGFPARSFFDFGGNALPVIEAFGQLAAPVRIKASLTPPALRLNWPPSGAALALVACTSLAAPAWVPVTNQVQTTGGVFSVTLPAYADDSRFFRLQPN